MNRHASHQSIPSDFGLGLLGDLKRTRPTPASNPVFFYATWRAKKKVKHARYITIFRPRLEFLWRFHYIQVV
jgi:hypothetical protein